MLLSSKTFLELENLYNDPIWLKPTKRTKRESNNCFFTFINQYNKNNKLDKIKKGTAKLKTAKNAKLLGAT